MGAMIVLVVVGVTGIGAGFLLLWRVRLLPVSVGGAGSASALSVVIPARNEESSLPRLLDSLVANDAREVVVVDDQSTDKTAALARERGAKVVASRMLPQGWTGKNHACLQGVEAASGDVLLFLDADTWMEPGGLARFAAAFEQGGGGDAAVSVMPYHVTLRPYEELSIFFQLLMAFGAGGFGALRRGRLFGQSMMISRAMYQRAGTHVAVRGEVLENFVLAGRIAAAGGRTVCFGGKGALNMRMFPDGFAQLCEGWMKAFAAGASRSDGLVLGVSIYWLAALCVIFLVLLLGPMRWIAGLFYAAAVLQLAWLARQIGSYRWYTFVLYPVGLVFFFVLFGRSLVRRVLRQQVTWRGRQI